ncbi:uncharacterized protein LOC111106655 isoform X3 [Crassostrea virginica]
MWPRPGCVPIVSGTVDNTAESKMMEKESVVENRKQNAFVTLLERSSYQAVDKSCKQVEEPHPVSRFHPSSLVGPLLQ